jgi:Arc/MetJ family transcription regulator
VATILYNMASHMKTTIEIPDRLLAEVRALAASRKTTMKAVVEEALRQAFEQRNRKPGFKLRKASFRGRGLHPDMAEGSWSRIRDLIYEGHGA